MHLFLALIFCWKVKRRRRDESVPGGIEFVDESMRRKHAVTQEVTDGKLHAKGRECKEYNKKRGGGGGGGQQVRESALVKVNFQADTSPWHSLISEKRTECSVRCRCKLCVYSRCVCCLTSLFGRTWENESLLSIKYPVLLCDKQVVETVRYCINYSKWVKTMLLYEVFLQIKAEIFFCLFFCRHFPVKSNINILWLMVGR